MRRWIAGLAVFALLGAAAAVWAFTRTRSQLDSVRREARLVGLAKSASDQNAQRLLKELRRVEARLDATERRLRQARAELRDAYRPVDVVSEVADKRFCFYPYDGRFSGFVRGPLKADVDGDGAADRVFTVGRPTLLGDDCRYIVVVDAGHTVYKDVVTARRLWMGSDPGESFQLYLGPRTAADLNGDGAAEVLLGVSQGAATHAGIFYTLDDGALTRVRVDGEPTDVVTYLGSLCCGGAIDCVDGYVALSGYGRTDRDGYVVTRQLHRLEGSTLAHVTTERRRTKSHAPKRLGEFHGRPLSGCDAFAQMKPPFPSAAGSPPVIKGSRG